VEELRRESRRRKRDEKGWEGLEGEDFPGKFRETPRPPDPTRTSFAQNTETATHSGAITYPFLPLAYAHMCGLETFSISL